MIARFLTEAIIHTMDKQKLKGGPEFLKNFPDFESDKPANSWDLFSVMNKFSELSVSPVKFVTGKDWVIFGAVCKVKDSRKKAKLIFQLFSHCYIQDPGSKDSRWVHMGSEDMTSSFLDDTKSNLTFLYKNVELGLKLISMKKTHLDALNTLRDMKNGKTRWKG